LKTLTTMLHEDENALNVNVNNDNASTVVTQSKNQSSPTLHIATTKCVDGSHHLFSFTGRSRFQSISTNWTTDEVLKAVKASCTIPASFHPSDILWTSQSLQYPDSDGVLVDGVYHCDGGIAAPAPGTPWDNDGGVCPIIVSPISAGSLSIFDRIQNTEVPKRISPEDDSFRLLPLSSLKCRGGFTVKPSMQNLRALRMASGLVSSGELQGWYDRGVEDAIRMVEEWDG